jgi:hypothetical protein
MAVYKQLPGPSNRTAGYDLRRKTMRGAQALPSLLPLLLALSSLSVVSAASGKQDQVLVCPLRFNYFLFLLIKSTLQMVPLADL